MSRSQYIEYWSRSFTRTRSIRSNRSAIDTYSPKRVSGVIQVCA
jgi:hypothetical protein